MSQAEDLTIRILDKPEFRAEVINVLMPRVYERARVAYQRNCPIGELLPRKEDKHLERKSSLRWDEEEGTKSKLVEPSGHPVDMEVTVVDGQGQFGRAKRFYVRINNKTPAMDDARERERYVAQRWGSG